MSRDTASLEDCDVKSLNMMDFGQIKSRPEDPDGLTI